MTTTPVDRTPGDRPQPTLPLEFEFDRGTALARCGADSATGTKFTATLDAGWCINGLMHGGLLMALAGRALSQHLDEAAGHPDPFSISGYFLSPTRPGPAEVQTTTVRTGRTVSTGAVSLTQRREDGTVVERLRVLANYCDLASTHGEVRTSATPPQMPPPEQCLGAEHAPPYFKEQADLLGRIDLRLDPATVGWGLGQPTGQGRIQGWLRFPDGRQPDPLMLLLAADVLPPASLDLGLAGWAPTLELTVHVRARPARGWLRVVHSTRNLAAGYLEEDAEIWDECGRLVAQSRQLAMIPTAPDSGPSGSAPQATGP